MFSTVPRFSHGCYLGVFCLVLFFGISYPAIADEDPPPAPEFREPETSPEQQRTVTVAIYLLIVLTIGAAASLIVMMLWGARVRRQARKPLPTTSRGDPLWYLKKPKSPPSEPDPPPGVSDGEGEADGAVED